MREEFFRKAEEYQSVHRRKKLWHKVVGALGCIAVFCTTYALILPAITLDGKPTYCGKTQHTHSADCYAQATTYSCGYEDHQHTDDCYTAALVCGTEEGTGGHTHTGDCYTLICELNDEEHAHDTSCYTLTCGQEESVGHVHDESCYGTESVLTCTLHVHTADCLGSALICGYEEEHTHTDACYIDTTADVETAADWEATLPTLTGSWRTDIVAIAQSQIGYHESTANYQLDDSGNKKGYTRYGEWYGMPYENWCAMFASFCIRYAEVPTEAFPTQSSCQSWITTLASEDYEMYLTREEMEEYAQTPEPGDLIFFDWNGDGTSDHVGFVEYVDGDTVHTIEGNSNDQVAQRSYAMDSTKIMGYGILPVVSDETSATGYTLDAADTIEGTDHPSTVINMFDYWLNDESEGTNEENNWNGYINYNHNLKFSKSKENSDYDAYGSFNIYTGGHNVWSGIVKNKLVNGYPVLDIPTALETGKNNGSSLIDDDAHNYESLAYLFDPATDNISKDSDGNDTDGGKASYKNVKGLLRSVDGYYYFNCASEGTTDGTFAVLNSDASGNKVTLYNNNGVTGNAPTQFFPFNTFSDAVSKKSSDSMNHYFGLTMTTKFIQQYGGHVDASESSKAMTFEFSGDDDVWIYIDDVLVADLGGIHSAATVSIDFSTGDVLINSGVNELTGNSNQNGITLNGETKTTLKAAFEAASKEDDVTWSETNGNTFADNTYHTLKFFYLERGAGSSNLKLKFNLTEIPATSIYKVDQYKDPVAGATFAVYKTENDGGYTIKGDAVYTGTTNEKGQMIFVDQATQMNLTISEIEELFGEEFVIKEISVPNGYRKVSSEIHMYIQDGLLLCANSKDSGVWSSADLYVTAPTSFNITKLGSVDNKKEEEFYSAEKDPVSTLFAVVLKYVGEDATTLTDNDWIINPQNWRAVSGAEFVGYDVIEHNTGESYTLDDVIKAAQTNVSDETDTPVFTLSNSGTMSLTLSALPGDITTYYRLLRDNGGNTSSTKYIVGFYWTTGTLEDATEANTYAVLADEVDDSSHKFYSTFGATVEVPNIENRFYVQKTEGEGADAVLVNGATFALYQVEAIESSDTSYGEDNTFVYIAGDGTQISRTAVNAAIEAGNIDENGVITVNDTTITPNQLQKTMAGTENANVTGEDGTAIFSKVVTGDYIVREISAPTGYQINSTEIMVRVDEYDIYANAGTADDGVTVGRGVGYSVATADVVSQYDDIDNTLTWIFSQLQVSSVSASFADAYKPDEDAPNAQYLTKNYDGTNLIDYNFNNGNTNSEDGSQILTAYLVYNNYEQQSVGDYNTNSIFNYALNADRLTEYADYLNENTSSGQQIRFTNFATDRRLYTNVGWSYLRIYQDYYWAMGRIDGETTLVKKHKSEGANYTALVELDGDNNHVTSWTDISNLFSTSTFIQVADVKTPGTLEISKTVTGTEDEGINLSDQSFEFTITLEEKTSSAVTTETTTEETTEATTDAATQTAAEETTEESATTTEETTEETTDTSTTGTTEGYKPYTGELTYTIYTVDDDDKRTPVEGKENLNLTAVDGTYTISLKDGQVAVIDKVPADAKYTVTETADASYETKVSVNDGDPTKSSVASGTIKWEATDAQPTTTVAYTNTYLPTLTIHKYQSHHHGTISTNDDGDKVTTPSTNLAGAEFTLYAEDGSFVDATTDEYGIAQFKGIADGVYTLVETKAPDGYNKLSSSVNIVVTNGRVRVVTNYATQDAFNHDDIKDITINENMLVEIPNDTGYELPSTGGGGTQIYVYSGLLMMASAVACGYLLRRKGRRRCER